MFVGVAPHIIRPLIPAIVGLRPQDVFAATLYTGNGAARTINTGLNLTGGGTIWIKDRTNATQYFLSSAARSIGNYLTIATGDGEVVDTNVINGLTTSGFNVGTNAGVNASGDNYVGWSFKKTAKFYTEVVYTGDGNANQVVSHDLGIVPGFIVIKPLNLASAWPVYFRTVTTTTGGNEYILALNRTSIAQLSGGQSFGGVDPSATTFTVNGNDGNQSNIVYLARIWAHDPSADGIIQCVKGATDSSGNLTVTLGWQPQLLITKAIDSAGGSWLINDTARGWTSTVNAGLFLNTTQAEQALAALTRPTATGFTLNGAAASTTYIFVAIRAPV